MALEALDFEKTNTARRGAALAWCVDKIIPKLPEMNAKVIKERKGNIAYLRQCRAFLAPYIRELRHKGVKMT